MLSLGFYFMQFIGHVILGFTSVVTSIIHLLLVHSWVRRVHSRYTPWMHPMGVLYMSTVDVIFDELYVQL